MDILRILQSCTTEEEFQNFLDNRLAECIEEGLELSDGCTFIGDNLGINPEYSLDPNSTIFGNYDINVYWQQFIPPNVKIVYCVELPFCTNGYYYYMNDFDYLFAFLDYIYDKKVYREIDLIGYIHLFLRKYFVNPFEENSRQKRFGLLCDKNGMYYPPSKERSILDFKGNSTAMCTEYGAVAQNIMSFFGMDTIYMHDRDHAYNIVSFSDGDKDISVVDFAKSVVLYDQLKKTKTLLPFIGDIKDCDENLLQKLVSSNYRLEFNEYRINKLGNIMMEEIFSKKRFYGSGGYLKKEKKIIK